MDLQLQNKNFIITGGTDGLGFATARALLGEGANVLVTGRTEEKFLNAQKQVSLPEARFAFFKGDNGDSNFVPALKNEIAARFGKIDGMLVSVGGPPSTKALETTDDQWMQAFESVFLGANRLIRELASSMKDGASIALVLSTSAKVSIPTIVISNGLRPGLAMLTKNYAEELGGRNIRVNSILPDLFATNRVKQLHGGAPQIFPNQSLKRIGEPEEFGKMAAILLSPAASYVTGSAFIIDGGLTKAL